jgi:hypothetical protein
MSAMMRQSRKQILTMALAGLIIAAGPAVPLARASVSALVTTIVTDPLTGVALDGFDPVSYFLDGPRQGRPEFEYVWAGVPWYFANAANRDAFIRAPRTYAPAYGGYGVMSLARGYLSDGDPHVYLIRNDRMLLFFSPENRAAFELAEAAALAAADTNWPRLQAELIGPEDVAPMLIAW